MRNYTPLHKTATPGLIHVHSTYIKFRKKICLPPPINQSTPASVSTISPQFSSYLDTDQGEIIDETLKQFLQTVNQILLKTTTGNPASNLDSSGTPHDKTSDRESASTLNTNNIHKQTTTSPKNTYRPDSSEHILTDQYKTKQIITDIDTL